MALGGVEEVVGERHHLLAIQPLLLLPLLDEHGDVDLLGAAPLVGGNGERIAEDLLHRPLQGVVAAAAAVGLVAAQHGGLHVLGDGTGAAVGQQVDEDILAVQQEGVHARPYDGLLPVGAGGALDRLDDTNAERFGKMLEVFHG
ncbi:hypothetical protein D3C75_864870 [compost metagenome]